MNIFKRLVKIGQAEVHSFVERMEDPVMMMRQGIEDLREELGEVLEAKARLKASLIRKQNELSEKVVEANAYEEKALYVLRKAQQAELSEAKAEQLAEEALRIKRSINEQILQLDTELVGFKQAHEDMSEKTEVLRYNISKWEKELATLSAKQKVAETSEIVNRHLAQIDQNSTIGLLQRMKERVLDQDANAQMDANISKTQLDQTVDELHTKDVVLKRLNELKGKLGL